jgi:orotidine-5'-phosphate decarboxylase
MTPADGLAAGDYFLVIGVPITAAPDPRGALEQIVADVV